MSQETILLLDGYNLFYRARSGYTRGPNSIVYNFFRSFRALVEKFSPDKIYVVLEGYPKRRKEEFVDYKAQRTYHDRDGFQRQKSEIISLLKSYFPVIVVRHPDYECDDVLAGLVTQRHSGDKCVVISSDSDFIQLLGENDNVSVYNPIRKKFVEAPMYDYVSWKSLVGDTSDNIPGFDGIGPKRADRLVSNPDLLREFLEGTDAVMPEVDRKKKFDKNYSLIKFHDLNGDLNVLEESSPMVNWVLIRKKFHEMTFSSITNDRSWKKFVDTFESVG
jgi:DNA polymerase-1